MFEPGKRPLYVITYQSYGDGNSHGIYLVSRNKKTALDFFRWLYNEAIYRDWLNDDGELYAERQININEDPEDKRKVRATFYYSDDDYGFDAELTTLYTDTPWGWNGPNMNLRDRYINYTNTRGADRNG